MTLQLAKGAEPIPGYQLVERLGTGGYGSVWKTTAPGGLTKAIKIVFGGMGGQKAEQELRALQRIKEVRHPFLLSLERIEVYEGQLLIVTELADASLLDRFNQCRNEGQWGIPRDELLGHLRDAADALDFMAENHGLQHLDIKPQNLLLVGGRIKVADFGLVKDLVGTSVTATGGVTPIYAPPEAFDGRVSRHSDQYSLAIVYQEMLTGVRPFPGTTVMQLAQQHMTGRPLLDPLPPPDRPAIARALSKVPEKRFPNCRTLVGHLLAGSAHVTPPPPAPGPVPSLPGDPSPPRPGPAPTAIVIPAEQERALFEGATVVGPVPVFGDPATPGSGGASGSKETAEPPREPSGSPSASPLGSLGAAWGGAESDSQGPPRGVLRPTLFLGLGGLACATLRRLKQRLCQRFGSLEAVPSLRILLVDTNRADLRAARLPGAGEPLGVEETLLAPLQPQEQYREKAKTYLRWLDRRWMYGIPRSQTTEGLRPLGRLALVDNAPDVLERVRTELQLLADKDSRANTESTTGLAWREEAPRVFLVASATGATGGGMLLGMAYAVQQALAQLRLPPDVLCGVLLYATSPKPADAELARLNAYATLQEVNHFTGTRHPYPGDPEQGLDPAEPGQAPFEDLYLAHLGEQLGKEDSAAATDLVAEYLFLDATSPAGAFLDHFRLQTRQPSGPAGLRTFGLDRIRFPRRRLAEHSAYLLCRGFIHRWRGEVDDDGQDALREEARKKAAELGLCTEAVVTRIQDNAEWILGEDPETFFLNLLNSSSAPEPSPQGRNGEGEGRPGEAEGPAAARTPPPPGPEGLLKRIDEALGVGVDPDGRSPASEAPLERDLIDNAEQKGSAIGQELVDWLLLRVEDPEQRLKSAECAAGKLCECLRKSAGGTDGWLRQVRADRHALRARLFQGDTSSRALPIPWRSTPKARRKGVDRRTQRLLDYCWLRLTEVVLEAAGRMLAAVSQQLSPFLQDLMICQQKLTHLADQFTPPPGPDPVAGEAPHLTELLPPVGDLQGQPAEGADGVEQAARWVLGRLTPEVLRQFEEQIQAEVLDPHGGLWGVLGNDGHAEGAPRRAAASLAFWNLISGTGDTAQKLCRHLLKRAQELVLDVLRDVDAARLFLDSSGGPEQALPLVQTHLEEARPALLVRGAWQHLVLLVPHSPAGETFRELAVRSARDLSVSAFPSDSDVLVCFEAASQPLPAVVAALVGSRGGSVPAELAQRVLVRHDVEWSPLPSAGAPASRPHPSPVRAG